MNIEWNTVRWYSMALAVVVFVVTFALGMYFGTEYQQLADRQIISDQAAKIAILSRTQATTTAQIKGGLTINAPKDGVSLCRGQKINVGWTASSTVDQVQVALSGPAPFNPFGQYPATWNDSGVKQLGTVQWTVGSSNANGSTANPNIDMPDGDNYRIQFDAYAQGIKIGSASSGVFSIQTCQG